MSDSGKPISHSFRQLLIRSVPDGFQFGKISSKDCTVQNLKLTSAVNFPDLFEKHLRENDWLNRSDLKVTLIDFTGRFMVLPNGYTQDDSVEEFFNFQNGEDDDQQIYTAPLDDDQQTFCWQIPYTRDKVFEKLLPNLTLLSSSYILANWTLNQATDVPCTLLTAHFYGNQMQLFAAEPGRLLFANNFGVKDVEEICYFLLRCVDQLGLDPHKLHVCLCCETLPFEELQALLAPYLAYISAGEFTFHPDQPFRFSDTKPEKA
jgi:hypothetical protein